jgi:hypothetical protein
MDVETKGDDKRLNNMVAITVVILSVFMAVSKIKDDNIVQAMQKAKSEAVVGSGRRLDRVPVLTHQAARRRERTRQPARAAERCHAGSRGCGQAGGGIRG